MESSTIPTQPSSARLCVSCCCSPCRAAGAFSPDASLGVVFSPPPLWVGSCVGMWLHGVGLRVLKSCVGQRTTAAGGVVRSPLFWCFHFDRVTVAAASSLTWLLGSFCFLLGDISWSLLPLLVLVLPCLCFLYLKVTTFPQPACMTALFECSLTSSIFFFFFEFYFLHSLVW